MNRAERINLITERLQQHFAPSLLEVIDDSDQHIGHVGSQGGAGHYTVKIKSDMLNHKSRVDSHREIYNVLNDLIPHEIHALRILL